LKLPFQPRARIRRLALSVAIAAAITLSLSIVLLLQKSALAAASVITWPSIGLARLTGAVSEPVFVTHAADGSGRIFIVERAGTIRIYKNGGLLGTPFLNISARVDSESFVERGLLSMAFPPSYTARHHFYVYYTDSHGNLVISRFGLTGNPDIADSTSEQIVLTITHSSQLNHNGGQLQFGPLDGYLYLATGDGGGAGDGPNNAQNPAELLGKMLRLDVESGNPVTYTVPSSNPFTQTMGYRPEIWALGLRNPWRFSFDRQMHDMYIGDVGQHDYEEVDFQPAGSAGGQNYGWHILEGFHCFISTNCNAPSGYVSPVVEYDHNAGDCAIAGGYVYRGNAYISMQGIYFYGDNCSGRIRALVNNGVNWQSGELMDTPYSISSFGEDEAGNLYLADLGGAIYQIVGLEQKTFVPIIVR
jgi:glucose/arabinose dehydrogenase